MIDKRIEAKLHDATPWDMGWGNDQQIVATYNEVWEADDKDFQGKLDDYKSLILNMIWDIQRKVAAL